MKVVRAVNQCCLDGGGRKRPFHLCCSDCRAVMSAASRARLLDRGAAPAACSSEIPVAPARGRVASFVEQRIMPKGDDDFEIVDMPYRSGTPGRVVDVFDVMADQSLRRGAEPPFMVSHVYAARCYRDLHERVQAAGFRPSSAFDDVPRGGGGLDFMDVHMRRVARLEAYHRAIGDGEAMAAAGRGNGRAISSMQLVFMVCLGQQPLASVLSAHGWSSAGKNRGKLRDALRSILERMASI